MAMARRLRLKTQCWFSLVLLAVACQARAEESLLANCRITKVSAHGFNSTLAVTEDGHVLGWGVSYNDLVLGSATDAEWVSAPVMIPDLDGVVDVDVSGWVLALRADGKVWSWGGNRTGALGNGTTVDSSVPAEIPGLDNVVAISANTHSAALRGDGTVWAWGSNGSNELGIPTPPAFVAVPGMVPGLTGVIAVEVGSGFTLALLGDGTLRAWGANVNGDLGIGTTSSSEMVPVQPIGMTGVVAIAAATFSMALKADGTVWWWGDRTGSTVPVQVTGLPLIQSIGATIAHGMAVARDGTGWSWGPNLYGQNGDGTKVTALTPVQMVGLPAGAVADLGGEFNSTVVVLADGTLLISGIGAQPQNDQPRLVPVPGIDNVVDIAAEWFNGFAVKSDGSLWGWGGNEQGELGIGTLDSSYSPTRILASGVAEVVAGQWYTLARLQDGTMASWGSNYYGQLGDGSTTRRLSPFVNPFLSNVAGLAAGQRHALAVLQDGTVQAWGNNDDGQLGNGSRVASTSPLPVPGLSGVVAVAADERGSTALKADGTLWYWGDGSLSPRQSTSTESFAAYSARGAYSTALTQSGAVYGGNGYWQDQHLGLPWCPSLSWTDNPIAGLGVVESVFQCEDQAFVVRTDGSVVGWGRNRMNSLGSYSSLPECSPVLLPDFVNVAQVDGGLAHTIVLHRDGTLSAVGWNFMGALGLGTSSGSLIHVQPGLDRLPLPQGNIIRATRAGADVRLNFTTGTGPAWRIYRDGAKSLLGTTALVPDSVGIVHDDLGAVTAAGDFFYQVRGATVCGGLLGP